MSEELIETGAFRPLGSEGDARWQMARHWVWVATTYDSRKIVAQVMAGFELMALHREAKIRTGPKGNNLRQIGANSWRSLVERELAIPYRTAQRWMQMAQVVDVTKMTLPDSVRAAVAVNTGQAEESDEAIVRFVDEFSRGMTQAELLKRGRRLKAAEEPKRGAEIPVIVALPAATERKLTPAQQLAEAYSKALPRDGELRDELERLELIMEVCRRWLKAELGERDIAVTQGNLGLLAEAA